MSARRENGTRCGVLLLTTLFAGLSGCGPTAEVPAVTLAADADPVDRSTVVHRPNESANEWLSSPGSSPVSDVQAKLDACRADSAASSAAYEARIATLEAELRVALRDRVERESEWLTYTRAITDLGTLADVPVASFRTDTVGDGAEGAVVESAPAAGIEEAPPAADLAARSHEIHVALRSLFAVEQVSGLDLLESGTLDRSAKPGAPSAIGPVVLRVLDERGRPISTLCAERLRFECSRAARTLTLILERGYERRAGERSPFSGFSGRAPIDPTRSGTPESEQDARTGERRILLPDIDPAAWVDAFPELFGPEARATLHDDGHWDLRALRAALNDLLRVDVAAGYHRLQGFGGVQGVTLRDVRLDRLDREGRLECRLFADRMTIALEEQGLEILLEDGAQVRGDQKTAFLDGRYRIFLPRADKRAWIEAGIPGLSGEPRSSD